MIKNCDICGAEFTTNRTRERTCSPECSKVLNRTRQVYKPAFLDTEGEDVRSMNRFLLGKIQGIRNIELPAFLRQQA